MKNNQRKENKTVKFAIIVLALTMIALILVAGTYAKYTSSGTGNDSVTVAKWSFTVGDKDISTASEAFTFDLFKTIKDTDGSAETDVKSGKLIAPGTSGSFKLDIKNESEVNAKYSATYTVTNANSVPLEFSVDGTTWKSNLNDLKVTDKAIAMGASDPITVQWRWVYEADRDENDTDLGVLAQGTAPTVTVKADVTATQVD